MEMIQIRTVSDEELTEILAAHHRWLQFQEGGRQADLDGVDLAGRDLQGANLEGAFLRSANLEDANLENANLEGADLTDARLVRANLARATLNEADLSGADLTDANLQGADLTGAEREGATLDGADFRGSIYRLPNRDWGPPETERPSRPMPHHEGRNLDALVREVTASESWQDFEASLRRGYVPTIRIRHDEDLRARRAKEHLTQEVTARGYVVFNGRGHVGPRETQLHGRGHVAPHEAREKSAQRTLADTRQASQAAPGESRGPNQPQQARAKGRSR